VQKEVNPGIIVIAVIICVGILGFIGWKVFGKPKQADESLRAKYTGQSSGGGPAGSSSSANAPGRPPGQ